MADDKKEGSKKEKSRAAKWVLALFVWGFSAYFLICLSAFIPTTIEAHHAEETWREWQKGYIDFLETSYAADSDFSKVNEESFITGATVADVYSARLNEIRYLASHNSYKVGLTQGTEYLYHGPFAAFMGKQFDYVYDTITEQLNMGIRSIELDANKVATADGGFEIRCLHSSLLESKSTAVDFKKGLHEIDMWLERNPDSLPLIVLVEPKGGKKFDEEAFDALDGMLFDVFGDKLLTPKKLLGEYDNFDDFRADNAYPTVETLKGKIIFLLHEKASLDTYIARDPDMQKSAMNIALEYKTVMKKGEKYSKYAFTVIINEASKHKDRIEKAINEGNFMVRTRLDKYAVVKENQYKDGIASGANILSTDYVPYVETRLYEYPDGEKSTETYFALLGNEYGKTVTLRGVDL